MRAARVVFAIDARPLCLRPPLQFDYIGRMISAAMYEPLLLLPGDQGRLVPGAACSWMKLRGGRELRFVLDGEKRWSDGRRVVPGDFMRTLQRAARHPYWTRFLSGLRMAKCDARGRLQLTLRDRMEHLPAMLSAVNFAPWRAGAGNGPYRLTGGISGKRYDLAPNPFYPGWESRPCLRFVVRRTLARVGSIPSGPSVSCGTAFQFSCLPRARRSPLYRFRRSGIFMQLEFKPERLDAGIRESLAKAVDRRVIAAALHGGLIPADRCGSDYLPAASRMPMFLPAGPGRSRSLRRKEPIRLSFHDYHPNRRVATMIGAQWRRRLGLRTKLDAVAFDDPSEREGDVALSLRFPAFPHARAGAEIGAAAQKGLVIPLFHVPNHYLQDPRIEGFSYPPHASFDFREVRCLAG